MAGQMTSYPNEHRFEPVKLLPLSDSSTNLRNKSCKLKTESLAANGENLKLSPGDSFDLILDCDLADEDMLSLSKPLELSFMSSNSQNKISNKSTGDIQGQQKNALPQSNATKRSNEVLKLQNSFGATQTSQSLQHLNNRGGLKRFDDNDSDYEFVNLSEWTSGHSAYQTPSKSQGSPVYNDDDSDGQEYDESDAASIMDFLKQLGKTDQEIKFPLRKPNTSKTTNN